MNNERNKKLFVTLITILAIVSVAFAVWFFFFNKNNPATTDGTSNSPFGTGGQTVDNNNNGGNLGDSGETDSGTTTMSGGPDMMLPGLYQISKNPVSGITVYDDKSSTHLRYVERATGHIFERIRGDISTTRITNTTIPRVYEAMWSSDGREVVMRYLRDDNETIRSFYTRLSASSTPDQEISGLFLDDKIRSISARGNKILFVRKNGTESSIILSNFDGSKPVSVFSSPFINWNVSLGGTGSAVIYSAPSANVVGSLYSVSLVNGSYKEIATDLGVEGLISPDGKTAVVTNNTLTMSTVKLNKSSSSLISLKTLAEKCVWSNDSITIYCAVPKNIQTRDKYPDSWHKGSSSFSDSLWAINTETGETTSIADLSALGKTNIDAVDLSINGSSNVITFKNKTDLSAWAYVLK